MSLRTLATIPILRIFDVAKAREFYVDFLGFTIDWEHRFDGVAPIYMQASRGAASFICRSITATPAPDRPCSSG